MTILVRLSAERRLTQRLLAVAGERVARGEPLSPYLVMYLAEHTGAAELWTELGRDVELIDRLDPDTVAVEAFRTSYGGHPLPPAVLTTMVARDQLRTASPAQRRLTRALTAARLRLTDPTVNDPRLLWARLQPITPHITLTGHTDPVTAVAFGTLPDGRALLATAGWDVTVRLWDPATGTPLGDPLTGHTGEVTAVAFGALPDGRTLLATGSLDGTVRLWDPATGTPAGDPLTGHTDRVTAVAFGALPDRRTLLATASEDGTVRLWDPANHRLIECCSVAPSTASALAIGESAVFIATADGGLFALEL